MPTTPYIEWDLPKVGGNTADWDSDLNAVFESLDDRLAAAVSVTPAGDGTATLDLSQGRVFTIDYSANVAVTTINLPATEQAYRFRVILTSTGTNTVTWFPNSLTIWAGSTPTAPGDGETDLYEFIRVPNPLDQTEPFDGGVFFGRQLADNAS